MATRAQTPSREMVVPAPMLPVRVSGMQAMASKMWIPFIAMGFMVVVAALIIGAIVSTTAADYFSFSKLTREAAATGSDLAKEKAIIESTKAWLPTFKFLGVGMIVGGVTFLLATILGALRVGGAGVQQALGETVRMPKPPMTAQMFPMVMMLGMMVLIAALVIAIVLAFISYGYWNHSIANELNPAVEGSQLLGTLSTINSTKMWLAPLKFVGMATLFVGVSLALATIIAALRWQSNRLWTMLSS